MAARAPSSTGTSQPISSSRFCSSGCSQKAAEQPSTIVSAPSSSMAAIDSFTAASSMSDVPLWMARSRSTWIGRSLGWLGVGSGKLTLRIEAQRSVMRYCTTRWYICMLCDSEMSTMENLLPKSPAMCICACAEVVTGMRYCRLISRASM